MSGESDPKDYGQADPTAQYQPAVPPAAMPPAAMPTAVMPAYDPTGATQYGQQHYAQPPSQGSDERAAEPSPTATGETKKKKAPSKKLWGGLVAAVIAVAAIIVVGFVVPGPLNIKDRLTKQVLSQEGIQNGVLGELDKAGVPVDTVKCPANIEVKVDATFSCDATINGVVKKVESKITSTDGDYTVMVPSGY